MTTRFSHFARWRTRHRSTEEVRHQTCVFIFSGGGLNGAAQVGMMRELAAAGVFPDAVVGVSAGALNATYVASRPITEAVTGLHDVWMQISRDGIFDANSPRRLWAVVRGHSSLDPGTKLAQIIKAHCSVTDLSQCTLPIRIGTLALDTAEMVWWSAGPAVELLRASAAIPGIFPPVIINGQVHVDGGVGSPVPVAAAIELNPTRLIVLDVSMISDPPSGDAVPSHIETRSALGVLLASFEALRRRVADAEQAAVAEAVEVFTIRAGVPGATDQDTLQRIPEIIELGAKAAREMLERHPELRTQQLLLT